MKYKPLVQDTGNLQQLQNQDELDIPLEARFQNLQMQFRTLLLWIVEQRMGEIPDELIKYIEEEP